MHFTLHTVFTAIELGRLLGAAHLPTTGRKKISAMTGELLHRTASMRVSRALREWGLPDMGTREVVLDSLDMHPTNSHGTYYRVCDAQNEELTYMWCPNQCNIIRGMPYRVLEPA